MIEILKKQQEFERLVGVPIDTILEKERNQMSEMFIYKAIEELVEARREFPSVLNEWSKSNKEANNQRVKEELSDAFLFISNLLLAWHIPWDDFLIQVRSTQENNFTKIKEKKMKRLNEEILNVPGYKSCIGTGSINPKYIFVGINPDVEIKHGQLAWTEDTASRKILIKNLKELGIHDQCYFTNMVKSTIVNNLDPSEESIGFWKTSLGEEIAILKINNPNARIITMGKLVRDNVVGDAYIDHPTSMLINAGAYDEYRMQIINSCGLQDIMF